MGSAVRCREGGGLAVVVVPGRQGPLAINGYWGGRRANQAAQSPRRSPQSGVGLRALGRRGSSDGAAGSRTRWTTVTAVTSWIRKKECNPSCASGAGRGGAGHGRCSVEVGEGDP